MADASINRPGVRVTQEFRTTSPTYLIPTMPACIMGPCFQVVEAVQDDGSLNSDALISLPARLLFPYTTTPFEYTSLGTRALVLSVNGAADEIITFVGDGTVDDELTCAEVVDEINAVEIPGLLAVVETADTQQRVVLYTTTADENSSIQIKTGTHANVLTAFGLTIGYTATGRSGYSNYFEAEMQIADYPDPRDNIDELTIDYDTVRVFVNDGAGNVREASRERSFLDGAQTAVSVEDDLDGDNLTPYVNVASAVFSVQPAELTGTVSWAGLDYTPGTGTFGTRTLKFTLNGVGDTPINVTVTFADPATPAAAAAAIDAALGANGSCVMSGNFPVITTAITGPNASILITDGGTISETAIGLLQGSFAAGKTSRARVQGTTNVMPAVHATSIHGKVLRMSVDGDAWQTLTFPATTDDPQDIIDAINGLWTNVASLVAVNVAATEVWQIDDPAGAPVFVSELADFNSFALADVDPWVAVEAGGDQFAIGHTGPFNKLVIRTSTAGVGGTLAWKYWNGSAWAAVTGLVDGTVGLTALGQNTVTFTMPTDWVARTLNGGASLYFLVAEVATLYAPNPVISHGEIGGWVVALQSQSEYGGRDSSVRIDSVATTPALLTAFGITAGVTEGAAFAPAVGDEFWADGVRLGTITEVVSGVDNRLRLSAEQLVSPAFTASSWYIMATGLSNDAPEWDAARPGSELYVDPYSGYVHVKQGLFRETDGDIPSAGPLAMYLAYTALRLDVTPDAADFTLLRFGSTTELDAAMSPLDTQNPLGFGMYIAMLNAPGVAVSGLGVNETSATEPEGSLDSYVASFEFLESKDVYAIVPLTHSGDVGQIAEIHVDAMSEPDQAMERYVLLNPTRPTTKSATLVASSPLANVVGAPTDDVQTGIANLQSLLAAAGMPGPTFTIDDAVYLELEDDTNKYLIQSVSGGTVTINDGSFVGGDNADDFFYDAAGGSVFADAIVDRPCTIKIRGAALANRDEEASAYADIARGYANRRVVVTAPDHAKATIDGLETVVDGYYLNCAVAGMRSARDPQQPLSNETVAGFTGVVGSQDRYSERQLKIMSGGGLWVFQQDAESGPVVIRHQLTSDMSTVEKREDNIRTALDFAAKFIRTGLRNFAGRFVLNTNVTDAVSITITGLGAFLVRAGVFLKFEVSALRQSTTDPTKIEIDCTVRAPYPLNDIDVTLVV